MGKHSARNIVPTAPADEQEAAPADIEQEAAPAVLVIVEQEAAPVDTADIEHQAEPTADEPTADEPTADEQEAAPADEQEAAPADVEQAEPEHGPTGDDDASREAIAFGRYADAFDAAVLAADLDAGWVPDGPTAHMKATLMSIGVTIGGRGAAAVTSRKLARLSAHDRVRGAAAEAAHAMGRAERGDRLYAIDIVCTPVAGWIDEPEAAPVATVDHARMLCDAFAALDVAARLLVAASDPADIERAASLAVNYAAADRIALRLFAAAAGGAVSKPTSTSKPTSGTSGTSGTKAPGTPIAPALRLVIDAHGTTSPDGRRGVTVADAKRHAAADHGISAGGAIDNHAKPVRGPGITAAQAAAGIEPATIGGTRWFLLV